MDDPLEALTEMINQIPPPAEVIDYSAMTDLELATAFSEVRHRLYALGEVLHAQTEEGRELHSRRTAILVAIHTRRKP